METKTETTSTSAVALNKKDISELGATKIAKIDTNVPTGLQKWMLKKTYDAIGCPPIQIQLWNGVKLGCRNDEVKSKIHVKTPKAFFKLMAYPDLFFGDSYARGDIVVEGSLVGFLETFYLGKAKGYKPHLMQRLLEQVFARPRKNNLEGSQENIHHHYNIGNDFYKLWLDKDLLYTCAYYPTIESSLEEAQAAKMEHVCRKLHLEPGQTVVEAGCGWGALAIYMAKNYGVNVKAYNISIEQIKYARERAKKEGLENQVEFIHADYRTAKGEFDAFVSVGMLEHVGTDHYENLGNLIDSCLKESGYGLLHFIGRNRPMPMNAWIEKRIFPGAYPPSLAEAMQIFESGQFSVLDVENLRLHYAKTLEHWLEKYEQESDTIREMFDDEFVNSWRLYLAGSIAAFLIGDLQLFQISFVNTHNNNIQWTRDFLYSDNETKTRQEPKWKHVMS